MTTVPVKQHVRRRTGKTARISTALGYGTDVKVGPYVRKRPAVPKWTQLGPDTFLGRYKDKYLAIIRRPIEANLPGWYWEVTDKEAGILANGVADTAGRASREAELAAGYKYAGEVIRAGMAFQDPTERTE